jgi:hypothetical protein
MVFFFFLFFFFFFLLVFLLFFYYFFPSCPLFIYLFVPSCLLLISRPFVCYLTTKDLRHSRFHFCNHGTRFFFGFLFFFPSCPFLIFLIFFSILSSIYFIFCSFLSSFDFSPLRLLCNNKDFRHRRFHFSSHGPFFSFFFFFFPSCPLIIFLLFFSILSSFYLFFVPSCPLLISHPFVCYLTNKDLRHSRFHFCSHGTCFFFGFFIYLYFLSFSKIKLLFFPSCPLFILFSVPSCPLLIARPFVCYVSNKDLGHRRFHFH